MYNIENKMIFNPEKNTLSGLGEQSNIEEVLARPTSRLLFELIQRNNELVTREELLSLVWADYGSIPSDSNLNNHLTLLRKRFDFWGIDRKSLETIPRKGVRLNVSVGTVSEGIPQEDIAIEENQPPSDTVLLEPDLKTATAVPLPPPGFRIKKTFLLAALLFCPAVMTYFISSHFYPTTISSNLYVEQCRVIPVTSGLIPHEKENRTALLSVLKNLIQKKRISCNEKKDIYITKRPYGNNIYVYVSDCKSGDPANYSSCQGYIFINR
jgi:DNA-binding winged helix-turn-helix (wHTH) protein